MSISDLQEKKLLFARWFLANKPKFYHWLIIFLFIVNIIFWVWALTNFGIWLLTYNRDQNSLSSLVSEQVNFSAWREKNSPASLRISPAIFSSSASQSQTYDLAALVSNPNQSWYLSSLTYQFVWDGGASRSATTYFLPQEKKYLLILGEKITNFSGSLQLKIVSSSWQRVDPDANLPVVSDSDFSFTSPNFFTSPDSKLVNMSFEITNDSPFGFWNAPINVILLSGGNLIGAQTLTLEKLLSGQTRKVELNWPGDLANPDQTEIELDINFFDRSVYIPL